MRERLFEFDLNEYRPLGEPTRFLGALATLFSRCKDEDVAPDRYLRYATDLAAEAAARVAAVAASGGDGTAAGESGQLADAARADFESARRQLELARAYARYQELLGKAGLIDFGDQVSLALRLLRDSPAARVEIQRRFRYVLVDEFQDTNRAQAELVELIAAHHGNVTVVGDDDQSIYKFRGAAISNILDFKKRHPRSRQIVLRRNYRSRAPILDASYRLIRFNDPDRLEFRNGIDKRLRAERRGDERPVRQLAFATGSEEADWIAKEIAGRVEAGSKARDFADPRQGQLGRGPGSPQPQHGLRAVALLGNVGSLCPAGDKAAARLPAFRRGSLVERGRLRPGRVGRLRARRSGSHRDRQLAPGGRIDLCGRS